jgi:hypothetical protein
MKTIFKFFVFLFTGLVAAFSPLSQQALEAQGMCCASCALKKEENDVEMVDSEEENKDD